MSFKKNKDIWELILDPPRSGSFNMAADQLLLDQYVYNPIPVFRIYEWECSTISMGRNEVLDNSINLMECEKLGIPVIRRITGGQSVFHGFDLTYSFVGEILNSRFRGNVLENYRFLAKGFYKFFEKLGLKPEYYIKSQSNLFDNHICFSSPSNYEILIEGKKIIGNAQKVKKINFLNNTSKRIFLQHGSIPLKHSFNLITKIFPKVNVKSLKKKMHSLESTGIFPSFSKNKLKEFLRNSFMETFNLEWKSKVWNEEELNLIYEYEKNFRSIKN